MASTEDMGKVSLSMNKASLQEVEDEGDTKKKIDRHCGFCLTLVPGAEVKLCSKCKRRAYCSKECQVADWKLSKSRPAFTGTVHGYGQGHKNWCGLPYGEEDLDWKVAPISGKGLGLVALRDLPPLYRIIVEGMQPMPSFLINASSCGYRPYHPEINVLTPLSETDIFEKFVTNAQGTPEGPKIGLRIARTNHSCDANSACAEEEGFNVLILYSNREIKKGDEICHSYARFNNVLHDGLTPNTPEDTRKTLSEKWGVTCPLSCICRDEETVKMVKKCRKMFQDCKRDSGRKNVVPLMETVIEMAGKLGCCAAIMSALHCLASRYAVKRKATLDKGKKYLELYYKFNQAVFHPGKEELKDLENYLKDISQLPGYLEAEK